MNLPHNPYAAPRSLPAQQRPSSGGAAAVLVGAAVGNGIAYATLYAVAWLYMWSLSAKGVSGAELYIRPYQNAWYLSFAHLVSFLSLFPGGCWSARLSTDRHLFHAFLAGLLISAFAVLQYTIPYELPIPFWSRVTSVIMPIPAFLLGAIWAQRAAKHINREDLTQKAGSSPLISNVKPHD